MFDPKQFFKNNTDEVMAKYDSLVARLSGFTPALSEEKLNSWFEAVSEKVLKQGLMTEANGLEANKASLKVFYDDIRPESYKTSYANPEYSVSIFGDVAGKLLSAVYSDFRNVKELVKTGMYYRAAEYLTLFFELYTAAEADSSKLAATYSAFKVSGGSDYSTDRIAMRFGTGFPYYRDLILGADLSTTDYLYDLGINVTENEMETSRHFNSMSAEEVSALAKNIVEGYIRGFKNMNKSLEGKTSALLIYNAGQERLVKEIHSMLKAKGMELLVDKPESTPVNRQYSFDHKFDVGLYLDEDYLEYSDRINKEAFKANEKVLSQYSGVIFIEKFGEKPFSPEIKESNIALTEGQRPLFMKRTTQSMMVRQQYMPRDKTSFCIVAFPSPEIGGKFKEIFDETVKINSLDNELYENIQQKIIDVLDKAEYVHVKGSGDNRTDIRVKMQKLNDPAGETNFVNCTADVNIPVGEVFTSPELKSTNGKLHLRETFLNSLKFEDLELDFTDGYVSGYNCANFDSEEKNKKYIVENLLDQRDTLPIGEFAIGTNTLAYQVSQKYGIMDILPILIIEKMGPHFAIGDTCFSHEEDHETFNPDGKKITAVENELSALRNSDPAKAYTNCHTDITLPYESLAYIKSVTHDGEEHYIIRDGKFVIPGTEPLNEYL